MIILAWFYYSSYYILLSILVTWMLNRMLGKLWLSPLIINAIAAIVLIAMVRLNLLDSQRASYALYMNYVPVVLTSIVMNGIVFVARQKKKD